MRILAMLLLCVAGVAQGQSTLDAVKSKGFVQCGVNTGLAGFSQPYIVAISADLIAPEPHHVVLEVGTGSGYQAAILAEIVKQVYTIEIVETLGLAAAQNLARLGYKNIEVRIGDGYKGWPEKAPFDGIVVTAAAPRVPRALVEQLKPGGRMVIPVGDRWEVQYLLLVTKRADGSIEQRNVLPVRFVPLVPGKK